MIRLHIFHVTVASRVLTARGVGWSRLLGPLESVCRGLPCKCDDHHRQGQMSFIALYVGSGRFFC